MNKISSSGGERSNRHKIVVAGIGAGGLNAVDRLSENKIAGVDLIAVDTDLQALDECKADKSIPIGGDLTGGDGTGGEVTLGIKAARGKRKSIERSMDNAELIFLTSGFGGGTGTGATPEIASWISGGEALTVGVVTTPFPFEGAERTKKAKQGIARLREEVDAFIVASNERLKSNLPEDISLLKAFQISDGILSQGVRAISDLITAPGLINLDLADVRSILSGAGQSLIGIGRARGEGRARRAARLASNNPLLEKTSVEGARRVILNITGGEGLTLEEAKKAAEVIKEVAGTDLQLIFGAIIKEDSEKEVTVTVIASNFSRIEEEDLSHSTQEMGEELLWQPKLDYSDYDIPAFIRRSRREEEND